MGATLSYLWLPRRRKTSSKRERGAPITSAGSNAAIKTATATITAVPPSRDGSDAITNAPPNATPPPPPQQPSHQPPSMPQPNTPRQLLPSCPSTFTKPWTFSPRTFHPFRLRLPRLFLPLPFSHPNPTAHHPKPKPKALPRKFPTMPRPSHTHPTVPSHIAAHLMPVRTKNRYIAAERRRRADDTLWHTYGRAGRWRRGRDCARREGVGVEEWEGGALVEWSDEDEEMGEQGGQGFNAKGGGLGAREGGNADGEGERQQKKKAAYCNVVDGKVKKMRSLRSASEQEAWDEEGRDLGEERSRRAWERMDEHDRRRIMRVVRACREGA